MTIRYFIGVDISKATLDWAVFDGQIIVLQSQSAILFRVKDIKFDHELSTAYFRQTGIR